MGKSERKPSSRQDYSSQTHWKKKPLLKKKEGGRVGCRGKTSFSERERSEKVSNEQESCHRKARKKRITPKSKPGKEDPTGQKKELS